MYALVNICGNDFSIEAVSENKKQLQRKLVKRARAYIRDYFLKDKNDTYDLEIGRDLSRSLDLAEKSDEGVNHWDDGDGSYVMSWDVTEVPFLKGRTKPLTVLMAFGAEPIRALDENDSAREQAEALEEYVDTDMLVKRTFQTAAERRAYLQGVADNYGWDSYVNLEKHYPAVAKRLATQIN